MSKFPMISRDDAERQGLRLYYTGEPCKRGHDSQRYTINGSCRDCTYRRMAPGPSLSHSNVKAIPVAFDHAPSAEELTLMSALLAGMASEFMRVIQALAARTDIHPQNKPHVAYGQTQPLFVAADRLPGAHGQPGPEGVRGAVSVMRVTPLPVVDSITGLEVRNDEDGQPSYRPNPFA